MFSVVCSSIRHPSANSRPKHLFRVTRYLFTFYRQISTKLANKYIHHVSGFIAGKVSVSEVKCQVILRPPRTLL